MSGVLDTDDLWNEERPAIEQEVAQDLSNPQYVFYTQLLEAMFQERPTPTMRWARGHRSTKPPGKCSTSFTTRGTPPTMPSS